MTDEDGNFENGNVNDTDSADLDGNIAEPDELDVDDDEDYRLQAVPDTPNGYTVDAAIVEDESHDPDLFTSFQTAAHTERLTQKQFAASVDWWNSAVRKYDVQGDEIKTAFQKFAKQQDFSQAQETGLVQWFSGVLEKSAAQLSLAKKIAKLAGSRPRSEAATAEIAMIFASTAYRTKNHPKHRAAVDKMLRLTGAK